MNRLSALAPILICLSAAPLMAAAVDLSAYRGFHFGATVADTVKEAGMRLSDVKEVHSRPALIQELSWRPGSSFQVLEKRVDPVRDGLLRFYNGQLFQIVVVYDRSKIEGLTEADVVDGIAALYGAPTRPGGEIEYRADTFHAAYGEVAPVLARWEDDACAINLVRTADQASYVLIMTSRSLEALASQASRDAVRLDLEQAPQKAAGLEQKRAADRQIELDKARVANKPNFRP